MCVLIVVSARNSSCASSAFERPEASSARISTSRSDSSETAGEGGWTSASRAANRSISLRVADGAITASPAATVRTAAASSSGRASLRRKPLAPARIAA